MSMGILSSNMELNDYARSSEPWNGLPMVEAATFHSIIYLRCPSNVVSTFNKSFHVIGIFFSN